MEGMDAQRRDPEWANDSTQSLAPQFYQGGGVREREGAGQVSAGERLTLVAAFDNLDSGEAARLEVVTRGYDPEPLLLKRRGDGPEQGEMAPGAGKDAPSAPADEEFGGGATVGATIGGTMGLLATTYLVPGIGAALPGVAPLVSTVAGAGLGALVGAGFDYANGDDAQPPARLHPGQVRLGGVLLVCRVKSDDAEAVASLLRRHRPLDLRVQ